MQAVGIESNVNSSFTVDPVFTRKCIEACGNLIGEYLVQHMPRDFELYEVWKCFCSC